MSASGMYGEMLAREYLEEHGMRVTATNYRFHHGEIDIVAEEGETLVFCEVKTRYNDAFGPPEAAITAPKQRQIRRVALGYLTEHGIRDRICRFDVVAIRVEAGVAYVNHLSDAFR